MKLEKREIVILVIMALVILLGVYSFFIAPSGKKNKAAATAVLATAAQGPVKTELIAADANAVLANSRISDYDKYIVKRAGMDSRSNPFIKKEVYREWLTKDNKAISGVKLIYSGYVDSKKDIVAIINGIEYRAGEKMAEEGFVLKHITPLKVLIFDKRSGTTMEIPIQE